MIIIRIFRFRLFKLIFILKRKKRIIIGKIIFGDFLGLFRFSGEHLSFRGVLIIKIYWEHLFLKLFDFKIKKETDKILKSGKKIRGLRLL